MNVTTHLSYCIVCNNELHGRKTKFCSNICKNKYWNKISYDKNKHIAYQKDRGLKRKSKLVEMSGGGCKRCGYNECIASLTFHHLNPTDKLFCLDMSSLCHRSWPSILSEYKKCELLCMNCHARLHYLENNPS